MNNKRINPILYFFIVYLLGIFGVHKFIDGNTKQGVLYLCTFGLCGFGWFYDFIKAGIVAVKYLINKDKYGNTQQSKFTEISTIDGYTFLFNENYVDIFKNEKRYFNGDIVLTSNNNQFLLIGGFFNDYDDKDGIVLISNNKLLAVKADCWCDFGFITNNGVAIVVSDNESIVILSDSKVSKYQVNFPLEKEYSLLSDNYCVFAYYDTDELFIKSVNTNTLKISSFDEEIENIKSKDENISLLLSNNILNVYFSTNELLQFNLENGIKLIK